MTCWLVATEERLAYVSRIISLSFWKRRLKTVGRSQAFLRVAAVLNEIESRILGNFRALAIYQKGVENGWDFISYFACQSATITESLG